MTPTESVTQYTYPEIPDNWRNMYSIEELKETFLKHGMECEEGKSFNINRFKEQNPGQPLPDHMTDPFNLCFALYAVCDEISKLKEN